MKKHTRILAFILALALLFALTGCSGSSAATSNTPAASNAPAVSNAPVSTKAAYTMKLASTESNTTVRSQMTEYFAELVSEYTNGQVVVEVYNGGQLGGTRDTIEGLPMGIADIVVESIGGLSTYSDFACVDAIPYMYSDYEHWYATWWESDVGQQILDKVGEDSGLKIMGPMYRGARIVTSTKKWTHPTELQGFKMRAPAIPVYINTWESLGCVVTPLDATEIFTALQQGTVNAQENSLSSSWGYSTAEVCDYVIMTNHVYSTDTFIFDQNYWDKLPADIQEAMTRAINDAAKYRIELELDQEVAYKQKFIDAGCEIVEVDSKEWVDAFSDFVPTYFPQLTDWYNAIQALV